MKNKKIVLAALSLGLIIGGGNNLIDNENVAYAAEESTDSTSEDLSKIEEQIKEKEAEKAELEEEAKNLEASKEDKSQLEAKLEKIDKDLEDSAAVYLPKFDEWAAADRKLKDEKAKLQPLESAFLEVKKAVMEDGDISRLDEMLEKQTPYEQQKYEVEKAQRAYDQKTDELFEVKPAYDLARQAVANDKPKIEKQIQNIDAANQEIQNQIDELNNQIAAKNKEIEELKAKKAEIEKEEADKAKAFENYKKKYSEKIDGLSDLTEEEKQAAKEEIANATSEDEVNQAYNKAYSKNQDAKYDREKKENEQKFEKAKEDAKKEIDDYGDKLTEEEKEAFKEQIDKAPTKGAIAGILKEAKKASEKKPEPENPQEPETPTMDEDYKDMFLENLLSLSKLTDEEKEAFKERIEKAKTNGEIYDIYNEAVDLNNSRDKKPEDPDSSENPDNPEEPTEPEEPEIDQDYKDMFLENLLSLSKLTDEEKEAFKERIEKAKTNGEIYDIYNEAVALNNLRDKKPEKPVDPVQPDEPENPQEPENPSDPTEPTDPSTPAEPSKPENPSHDNDDYLIIPPAITNPSTTEVVKGDVIYVPKGYAHIKEGFYKKSDLIDRHNRLRKAVKENRIQVKAAEFLLEYTPKTVASVKDKLINLIEKSNKLVKKGKDVLEEYDKILDLDDKCYAL